MKNKKDYPIGYKVVIPKGENYSSACIFGKNAITYKVGEWTHKLKFGPLVFKELSDALDFLEFTRRAEWDAGEPVIFECEYDGDVATMGILTADDVSDMPRRKLFRILQTAVDKVKDVVGTFFIWPAPNGTIVTNRIRLIRLVDDILD